MKKTKWTIDPAHSEIGFKIRHLMIAYVTGRFTVFDGTATTNGNDFRTADVDVWVDASSVTTGDAKRDAHLRSAEFFDTENHRQITFSTTGIRKSAGKMYELWGNLNIRGIPREIKLDVEFGGITKDESGKEKAGFTITGSINRKDWNLNWNSLLESGGTVVGDEVFINCEIEVIKKQDEEMKMEMETSAEEEISAE
jgi:polyisoprenoid-binding protein YceI